MEVGAKLVACARAAGRESIAVIGTAKGVGKTVTVAALCAALAGEHEVAGLTSIGRKKEPPSPLERSMEPRLFLREGTLFTTSRASMLGCQALEILAPIVEQTLSEPLVLARVRVPGYYEVVGATSLEFVRHSVRELGKAGASFVILEGSVDDVAAVRDGEDAIVVATGASKGATPEHVVEDVRALVARLSLPLYDPARAFLRIGGTLRIEEAVMLARAGERRQILVRDATCIAFGGRSFLSLASQLDFRCVCALVPIAATIASIGSGRFFEPRAFLRSVAETTGLPAYDVYAQSAA